MIPTWGPFNLSDSGSIQYLPLFWQILYLSKNISYLLEYKLNCHKILWSTWSDFDRAKIVSGQIQLISGGPSAVYWADRPRLHSGHIIGVTEAYRCIWRTVCGTWADCPCCNFFCWSEPLVKNFMNGGPSALPNFRQLRILPIFTISTLNLDYCSNKIQKISKQAWTPSKNSYEWVRMRNQKEIE